MGIMTLRLMQVRLVVSVFAAGILALTATGAWAFSQETVSPGSNGGNYNFGDPDKQVANPDNQNSSQGVHAFGSNGPTVQFGVQQGSGAFSRGNGYNNSLPDPYFRTLNNGN
jgi:hypothetical protein